MDISTIIFYVLTLVIISGASAVLLLPNPIYSALSLAITMISLGFMYIQLEAYFIASVQLIVYAGAVMVLFVMVLMLFDLEHQPESMASGTISTFLKIFCGVIFTGVISWAIKISISGSAKSSLLQTAEDQMANVKLMAIKLFTQYLFAFEILGILLLVIAIGVVAVSRTKGGTHARD
ncbi:MAG: NADH-quinone oxidoreductase subunit J [Bdellovibrionales bacterium]|nr:NADH-quinone oxidoreductase subunit J [Bdellovibrionales bacterium]